ncbi:MAG: DUF2807 domain-containing protein [Phaeodactylibacter sp.]|nr:DUF2807 domain-containing protein [Phaeodactylibacter sp.]
MKRIFWIISALAITISAAGCFIDLDDDDDFFGCVNGEGPSVTRTISISDFDGIELAISADVFITQGPVQDVVVEGKSNIIDELERDVHNGVWRIEFDRCVRDIGTLRVFITMPELTSLRVSGSGDIISENTFVTNDLEFNIPGSGNIDLAVEADDIDGELSGSGRLLLEGTADEVKYRISGSGDVRAFNLDCRTADISIPGSGDCEVTVSEFLKVRISGSGDVFFKGNPSLDVNITGSGNVIDAN